MAKNGTPTNRRFTSERNARSFAKKVGGEFKDFRPHPDRKSDFKVEYKVDKKRHRDNNNYNPADFDTDINMNGMRWHTADDL